MWPDTVLTSGLGIRFPIVLGPFGGGLSSPRLVAAVSNAGGLGSFGAQGMKPEEIRHAASAIRQLTSAPFALNLWVSTEDPELARITEADFDTAVERVRPLYEELGVDPPRWPLPARPSFEEQVEAVLETRPAAFSFIYGVPHASVIDRCRTAGIVTIGAATTVEEARTLDAAGVDAIVASGLEAAGHRPSFLESAEQSLMGTLALVPQVVDAVRVPVVAAGGIADGRGLAAALTLGASGAQIGTAFLACDESDIPVLYREALWRPGTHGTTLSRMFSGRLARGLSNRVTDLRQNAAALPYPLQSYLISGLRDPAMRAGRTDVVTIWGGQSRPLLKHRRAADLFASLTREAEAILTV